MFCECLIYLKVGELRQVQHQTGHVGIVTIVVSTFNHKEQLRRSAVTGVTGVAIHVKF